MIPGIATSPVRDAERRPTRRQAALFVAKTWGLRLARVLRERRHGRLPRFARNLGTPGNLGPVLGESRTLLRPSNLPAEQALQTGKVQNLRVAAPALDGLIVPAGKVFSFWAHVPRPTRRAGFLPGRELREGCVVPSVGGGLCNLSNALYDAALTAGFEIVERHAHSRRLPGSMAEIDRDATVFWNYVDLRFRPPAGCRIEVALTPTELVIRFRALVDSGAPATAPPPPTLPSADLPLFSGAPVESCETCGVSTCFRHPVRHPHATGSVTAWLVDAHWPEFDRYLCNMHAPEDWLFLPLDGQRLRLRAYVWPTANFAGVRQAPLETLRRSWTSRRLAAQGAERQRASLHFDAALAARFARNLPPDAAHLVVSQNLLPFLGRTGALGGRSFDVLMTRLPLSVLQTTLDRAVALHPDSPTLADFRADPAVIDAENTALAAAARWITPHSAIARLAGARAHRLPWQVPADEPSAAPRISEDGYVLFPASTLGRKGAYELREVARELGLWVKLGGPVLEKPNFWHGVKTVSPTDPDAASLPRAVVLPAWVEHQPRRLLAAVATGIPVIATEACGLADVPGVTTIPTGDAAALLSNLAMTPAVCHHRGNASLH